MRPWQVITICTILLRRAAQICPPICLRGTVSQFLHSHNPFKIPACGGLFSPYGKSFWPEVAYGKSFRPDTPHPRRGASVELSEGESDPSQTYVSPFRIPVSPMHPSPLIMLRLTSYLVWTSSRRLLENHL